MGENTVKRIRILGVPVDNVTLEGAYKVFLDFINNDRTYTIYTPNPEIIIKATEDVEFKDVLASGDLIVPDGMGLIYASKFLNLGLQSRVAGIDLMAKMLNYLASTKGSAYLFGAKNNIIEAASQNIESKYPNIKILGYSSGYFDDDEEQKIIADINEKKPDVLFVGLGAPKQEKWIHKNKKILNAKVIIGVGGSFDVYSGHIKRAPKIVQKSGFEWLYRVILDPKRFKRLIFLPKFIVKVLKEKSSKF